ncbi:MAG: UvrD-helicase domain-containing protein [Bacilli bacterium]|nr:UvrD-helicase domain-containing protein [Bacilli bacterium]
MDSEYIFLYDELKDILKCMREELMKTSYKPYYYIFNDGELVKLVENLPMDRLELQECGIYGSKYYKYGDKIIETIKKFIELHQIDVNNWKKHKFVIKQGMIKNGKTNYVNNKFKIDDTYIHEGMKAKFVENNNNIFDVIICDIHAEQGVKFCSLKYSSTNNYLFKHGQSEPRVWVLDKLINSGNLIFDDKFLNAQAKLVEDIKGKINNYKMFVNEHILFENEKLVFDEQQCAAIVSNDNSIVTARAGSGKTRTIIGKIIYEIEVQKMNQKNIMAFCFNKEAANEINKRISEKCLIDGEPKYLHDKFARTFHSLAHDIVNPKNDNKILENKTKFLKIILNEMIKKDTLFREEVYDFFYSSLNYIDRKTFTSLEDYYKFKRNSSYKTLNGETVKSYSEKIIADYLFEHGIDYVYEKSFFPYKIAPRWNCLIDRNDYKEFMRLVDGKKETKPDFYLKKYNFVWENWGVNGKETLKEIFDFESSVGNYNYYINNMNWKKQFWNFPNMKHLVHTKYNDTFNCIKGLIETNAKEFENISREKAEAIIEEKLKGYGVYDQKLPEEVLQRKVWEKGIDGFTILMEQFINKLQQYYYDDVSSLTNQFDAILDPKVKSFYNLGYKVYLEYIKELHAEIKSPSLEEFKYCRLDFNELMHNAIVLVRNGNYDHVIKELNWVLIDEYQDFSRLFDNLISAILEINSNIKIFAVGDDWQAINRFAGSNTKYFNGFLSNYENAKEFSVTNNYRSFKNIVTTANKFMIDHKYSGKPAVSVSMYEGEVNVLDTDSIFMNSEDKVDNYIGRLTYENMEKWDLSRCFRICYDIISKNPKSNIMILNRSNSILGIDLLEFERMLKKIVKNCSKYGPDMNKIKISTVHASKGEEADVVILLNVNEKSFPVYNVNNELFTLFDQNYMDAIEDEEKLFYVALTRAKESIYILHTKNKTSDFVKSILESNKK